MYNLYFALFGPLLWAYYGNAMWKCADFSYRESKGIMISGQNQNGEDWSYSLTTVGIIYWNEVINYY